MNRIAAIYDIHGNLPALEAVLREIRETGVDSIVVGGDVVPGPMPREALEALLDLDIPVHCIRGNGEAAVLAERSGGPAPNLPEQVREVIRWSAEQLDHEHEQVLGGWPATVQLAVEGIGDVLFCHGTPSSDTTIFTRATPEQRLLPVFEGVDAAVVVCGHTHMQFDLRIGGIRVVNAGSVGMPYGVPGAYWLMLGPGIDLRYTAYDLEAAAERIRRTAYPQADEFAGNDLLHPRSEAETLALFSQFELRQP
jgi:putative phosphoesterase